jgi:hypothetical protein
MDDTSTSTTGNDPFGLSHRRRHSNNSRISTTLAQQQQAPHEHVSPQRTRSKGDARASARLTVETAANTEFSTSVDDSAETSPPPTLTISTPTLPWSNDVVSRISPQETVSPLDVPRNHNHSLRPSRMSLDASVQSQSMRKQLLQLVTSLQSNLKESQDARQDQQLQLSTLENEINSLREQLQETQRAHEEKEILAEKQFEEREQQCKQRQEFLEHELQQWKDAHAEEALRLRQEMEERQRAFQLEVKEFCAERDAQQHFLDQEKEKLHTFQQSVERESQNLARERAQVHALQQQLSQLQTTQLDLESTHQEEEERLLQAAEELDRKQAEWEQRSYNLEQEQKQARVTWKQQQSQLQHERQSWNKSVQEQEGKLQSWQRSLETQQAQLDEKESQVEASLAEKVQDLATLEAQLLTQREELLQQGESMESRFQLQEQALHEMMEQRREEEDRLEHATRHLEQVSLQSKKIRTDAKKVKEALQGKMARSHVEYERLSRDVETKKQELEDFKQRLALFCLEDRKSRMAAQETRQQLESELRLLETKVQNAREQQALVERDTIVTQNEHDCLVLQVQTEKELWETRRQEMEHGMEALRQSAVDEIVKLERECSQRQEAASQELEERLQRCEEMRASMEIQATLLKNAKEQLVKDQDECAFEKVRLDRLLHFVDGATEQNAQKRADTEWELQRLQSLLETERNSHEQHVRSEQERQEGALERVRQEHRDELQSLATRIEMLEEEISQLEGDCMDARDAAAEHERVSSLQVNSLVEEKKRVDEELASALKRANAWEKEVRRLENEREKSLLRETEELEKIRHLMERLEVNETKLEQKLKAVEFEEQLVERQKEQVREQLEASRQAGKELTERLDKLVEKVNLELRHCHPFDLTCVNSLLTLSFMLPGTGLGREGVGFGATTIRSRDQES